MTRRIAVFMGTRPEAIKLAPVIARLRDASQFECIVINTGQHREMIRQVIDVFGIEVDDDLDVMLPGQTLSGLTSRLVSAIDDVLEQRGPDMVLVQGDTTTVLCAGLAAYYRQIAIGHVEAGLRSGNLHSPFPEEGLRRMVSVIAALHFAPTEKAKKALLDEGVDPRSISVTGNTVIDALMMERSRQESTAVAARIESNLRTAIGDDWQNRSKVLITGHRRENFGDGFAEICRALKSLSAGYPRHLFVYPVHLNPRVRQPVNELLSSIENVRLIEPLAYPEFVRLMADSRLILSDSGGVQEEAPTLGKPVLVMRDTTEREEGIRAGTARLVGASAQSIVSATQELLNDETAYRKMATAVNPYGDGQASERILETIDSYFSSTASKCHDFPTSRHVVAG